MMNYQDSVYFVISPKGESWPLVSTLIRGWTDWWAMHISRWWRIQWYYLGYQNRLAYSYISRLALFNRATKMIHYECTFPHVLTLLNSCLAQPLRYMKDGTVHFVIHQTWRCSGHFWANCPPSSQICNCLVFCNEVDLAGQGQSCVKLAQCRLQASVNFFTLGR